MDDDDYYSYNYSDDEYGDYEISDDESMEMNESKENPNAAPVFPYAKKPGIQMLPADQVVPEMKQKLADATEILGIPESAAVVLMRNFNWQRDVLLEAFFKDPDRLLKKHGVYHRVNPKPALKSPHCAICYDDVEEKMAMPCGHAFCMDCWHDFCANAIQEEGPACVCTTCPDAACNEIVTEEEVSKAAPDHLQKFKTYQLRNFVESNTLTRWCPGAGCERVATAHSAAAMEQDDNVAHCDYEGCQCSFCMKCGEEPHSPTDCKELGLWNEKCRNESETANWILANTKSCPKCLSRIEKNHGCNHMTCQKCKHEFCWICMGDWSQHGANTGGFYKCNKYDAENGNGNGDDLSDAARAKRELDRYLHYYKRFHAHAEAQKFARKQLKETESRMVLLQESSDDVKWSDVEFLKTANEQLVECRRVLKYSYVYAYYLKPQFEIQKQRFEHHQEMLERFTETLSELSEKPLADMDRTDVVNKTRVVDQFMKNILKYVADGMDD